MLYQMMIPWLEKLMRKSVNTIPQKQVQKQSILFFFFLITCVWVFIAVYRLSVVAASRCYSLVAIRGLLIVVPSLVAEHRLWAHWLQ